DAFGNEIMVAPIVFAAHARPDGTFSKDDDAARARAHKACPTRPTLTLAGDETDARTIVCARLWGEQTPTLLKEIRMTCVLDVEAGMAPWQSCRDWEEGLANIEPPFRLDKRP